MLNPFGVNHGYFSKGLEESVANRIEPAAPSTAVDVYRHSKKNKKEAALTNWGLKAGAAAAGFALGAKGFKTIAPKLKVLNKPSTVKVLKKPLTVSEETKRHLAFTGMTGATAGAAGYTTAVGHKKHVKKHPKFKYKEPKNG